MGHDVKLQLVESMKLLLTIHVFFKWTFKLSLLVMAQHVSFQFIFPVELCPALITGERQFSGVYQLVHL